MQLPVAMILATLTVAVLGFPCPVATAARAATVVDGATSCRDVTTPVTAGSRAGVIAGTLCVPPGASTVQVLMAGNTYNRSYWQAELPSGGYDYVRAATLAGYATLALDRLGTGASLHPVRGEMTLGNDVASLHQVVTAVRAHAFGVFARVIGVGHSLGSAVLNQDAAARPGDFDALVLTGFSHSINLANATMRAASRYEFPAGDPRFAGRGLDNSYVATPPGGRTAFYAPRAVDRTVLDWDDQNRDTGNTVELSELGRFQIPNASRAIKAPVFVVDGSRDAVACGLASDDCTDSPHLLAAERPWFAPDEALTALSVPGDGHNVTMHRDAVAVDRAVTAWIERTVGPGGTTPSTAGDLPHGSAPTTGNPDAAVGAIDAILTPATALVSDTWARAVDPIPGLGDTTNPAPAYDDALRALADLPAAEQLPPP